MLFLLSSQPVIRTYGNTNVCKYIKKDSHPRVGITVLILYGDLKTEIISFIKIAS